MNIASFFKDKQGRTVIVEPPNLPLVITLLAAALGIVARNSIFGLEAAYICFGALCVWSWLEVTTGASPFRKSLGVAGFIAAAALAQYLMTG